MEPTNQGEPSKLSQVNRIGEGKIQEHLGEAVRSTAEETLNAMLGADSEGLRRVERYASSLPAMKSNYPTTSLQPTVAGFNVTKQGTISRGKPIIALV
jgi:hypothetical protein